jgi:hypothetical protein
MLRTCVFVLCLALCEWAALKLGHGPAPLVGKALIGFLCDRCLPHQSPL